MSEELDIDAIARRAGAELRVPPPAAAIARVQRGHRAHNRRLATAALLATIAVAGVSVGARPRSLKPLITGDPGTTIAAPATSPSATTASTVSVTSTTLVSNPLAALETDQSGGIVRISRVGDWRVLNQPAPRPNDASPDAVAIVVVKPTGEQVPIYGRDLPVDQRPVQGKAFGFGVGMSRAGSWLVLSVPGGRLRAVNVDTGERRNVDVELSDKSGFLIDSAWSNHTVVVTGSTRIDSQLMVVVANGLGPEISNPLAIWTGTEQIAFGVDNQAGAAPVFEPNVYTASTGRRRSIPRPTWWKGTWPISAPHQGGDTQFATMLGAEALLSDGLPGGFTGLFDPATNTWRQIDSPPIPTNQATVIDLADAVVVIRSFTRQDGPGASEAVRLDKATLKWTQFTLMLTATPEFGLLMQARKFGAIWMVGQGPRALAVVESGTGAWREPTSVDQTDWERYEGEFPKSALVLNPR
jgi:hypothetical protein